MGTPKILHTHSKCNNETSDKQEITACWWSSSDLGLAHFVRIAGVPSRGVSISIPLLAPVFSSRKLDTLASLARLR
jgi:hypothetical protein